MKTIVSNPYGHLPPWSLDNPDYRSQKNSATLSERPEPAKIRELTRRDGGKPRTFFRPGDRTNPAHPYYLRADENNMSYVGIIANLSEHASRVEPTMSCLFSVRVVLRMAYRFVDIPEHAFEGAYSWITSKAALRHELEEIYGVAPKNDDIITQTVISYI